MVASSKMVCAAVALLASSASAQQGYEWGPVDVESQLLANTQAGEESYVARQLHDHAASGSGSAHAHSGSAAMSGSSGSGSGSTPSWLADALITSPPDGTEVVQGGYKVQYDLPAGITPAAFATDLKAATETALAAQYPDAAQITVTVTVASRRLDSLALENEWNIDVQELARRLAAASFNIAYAMAVEPSAAAAIAADTGMMATLAAAIETNVQAIEPSVYGGLSMTVLETYAPEAPVAGTITLASPSSAVKASAAGLVAAFFMLL